MVNKTKTFLVLLALSFWLFSSAGVSVAQTRTDYPTPTPYTLLAPIPLNGAGSKPAEQTTTASYIPGLIKLTIAIAGMLAVIRIIYGGFLYISSDGFGNKSNAKSIIENALWGLILAMSAWLILYTINPNLVNINLSITPQYLETDTAIDAATLPNIKTPTQAVPCATCVTLAVPGKTAAQNGCLGTGICRIDSALNASLVLLYSAEPNLYVTEAYPPTFPHNDPCHSAGTCVDAKIENSNTPTPQEVKRFLQHAEEAGLGKTFFEALTTARRTALISGGVDPAKVIVTDGNGEHFHVKK